MADQPPSDVLGAFDHTLGIWPIDVTTLNKGDDVIAAECERIIGYPSTHPKYPFELMALREFVIRESMRRHTPFSVAIRGASLHINTDSEAVDYHEDLARKGERAIYRNVHMMRQAIDPGRLTQEQRQTLDRNTALWAMKIGRLRDPAVLAAAATPLPAIEQASTPDHGTSL